MLLFLLALMTLGAIAFAVVPLLRRTLARPDRDKADMRIYRDQLAEVEADRARGLIGGPEAEGAKREIERRLVHAFDNARAAEASSGQEAARVESAPRRRRPLLAASIVALGIPVIAGLIYAQIGSAGDIGALPWKPSLEQRRIAEFQSLLQQLETKVKAEPNRPEGWALLGRMYAAAQRFDDAAQAFERAASLQPGEPQLYVAAGEARIMAADGKVTAQADALLEKALKLDPHNPGGRFYKGLRLWQSGEKRAAYAIWDKLVSEAPADAPWLPDVRARLGEMAQSLGIAPRPEPAAAADAAASSNEAMRQAANMSSEERAAMIRGMVDRLAARLKADPDDLGGWMRLGRSYAVLGEADNAVSAFERAEKLAPTDPDVLAGLGHARAHAGDRAGALIALRAAREHLPAGDPRRDQIEQTIRSVQAPGASDPAGAAGR